MDDSSLALYEPLNTLQAVHDGIWIVNGPIVRMAVLGTSFPFPTRMTIVRLGSGELWCHSPTELTPALKAEIDGLGPVRHLVSPNKIHYAFIPAWSRAYPDATTWASPGVRERAARQKIEVTFDADLLDKPPPQWVDDIDQLVFQGSRVMEEVAFFHRKSETLILADLIENFELDKIPAKFRWIMSLGGCIDPDGKAPLDLRLTFWGRRAKGRECLKRILAWNPEAVILAHGRWYKNNGVAELRRAFHWLE